MRPPIALIVCLFLFVGSQSYALDLRVRIAEGMQATEVRGFDLKIGGHSFDKVSRWAVQCSGGKFEIKPLSARSKIRLPGEFVGPLQITSPSGFITVAGKPYRDSIHIIPAGRNCDVVNTVDIEKYLDGLVNAEFSAKWKEEAIVAQVVAARTYAYYQLKTMGPGRHFDVDATTRDQVYDGSVREDFRSSIAVNRTRGVILTVSDAPEVTPIKAFYHSTCGGRSDLPINVWRKAYPGVARSRSCTFCKGSPSFRWEQVIPSREIAEAVLKGGEQPRLDSKRWPQGWERFVKEGKLVLFQALDPGREERGSGLVFGFQLGGRRFNLRTQASQFRDWIGPKRLKSSWFKVTQYNAASQIWTLSGHGSGHGVGMCQWGAKAMGEQKFSAAQILSNYYPQAELKKLW